MIFIVMVKERGKNSLFMIGFIPILSKIVSFGKNSIVRIYEVI